VVSELQLGIFGAVLEVFSYCRSLLGVSAISEFVILLSLDEGLADLVGTSGAGSWLVWHRNNFTDLIEKVYFINEHRQSLGCSRLVEDFNEFQRSQSDGITLLILGNQRYIFQSKPLLVFNSLDQEYDQRYNTC
jgi:hypothetical protein